MTTPNETQTINQLYQNTRAQLYGVVADCPHATCLTVSAKHELVQWAFLQWVAVNDEWTNTTERYWERQDPLPFDATLVGDALRLGITSLSNRNNLVLDDNQDPTMNFQNVLPFCQPSLATVVAQRLTALSQGAAPGLQDDNKVSDKNINTDMVV